MRMRKEVFILSIDDILPNRFQPRIRFDEKAILELAESIKKHGVIQPVIVRKIADKYEIIAGERRYKASIIAGRKTIPAIITDVDDKESAEIALIENVQREDMTPIEEAISYKKILDMGYLTQAELAKKLGKTQSTIANKLRLLNLCDEVQDALLEEKISERHARSLLKVEKNKQADILNKIITERLTVRKTDQLIDSLKTKKEEKGDNMNNNMNDINNSFGTPSEPVVNNVEPANEGFTPFNPQPMQSQPQPFNPFAAPAEPQAEVAPMPEVEAAPEVQPFGTAPVEPQPFNPFAAPAEPQAEVAPMPEVEAAPEVQPFGTAPVEPQPFNPFAAPTQPQAEVAPMPEVEAAPEVQPFGTAPVEPQPFNPFAAPTQPQAEVAPMPEVEAAPEVQPFGTASVEPQPFNPFAAPAEPQAEVAPMPEVEAAPEVQPFGTAPVEPQPFNSFASTPNYPLPETQELQPLMPEASEVEKVEINTVINTMRDCIKQIESFGYKVDSEEVDLPNLYEFTIKIEK